MSREKIDEHVMASLAKIMDQFSDEPELREYLDDVMIASGAIAKACMYIQRHHPELEFPFNTVSSMWMQATTSAMNVVIPMEGP